MSSDSSRSRPRDRDESREDTALTSLSPEDRSRLVMDSWEPSLLRELLTAQNKLKKNKRRG